MVINGLCLKESRKMKINVLKCDITTLQVDAIVNAANRSLLGGGGVDGAIHGAAGPELLKECRTLNGCETGEAKITKGYNLPAKFVIHTVGPVWFGGTSDEPIMLYKCYKNSLKLAEENGIKSVAFPAISTGVYGYPSEEAAKVAFKAITTFAKEAKVVEEVTMVAFDEYTEELYKKQLE